MDQLLAGLAVAAVFVAYLLLFDPGAGRGALGMVAGLALTYTAAVGWLPLPIAALGVAVFAISGVGTIYGWWDDPKPRKNRNRRNHRGHHHN